MDEGEDGESWFPHQSVCLSGGVSFYCLNSFIHSRTASQAVCFAAANTKQDGALQKVFRFNKIMILIHLHFLVGTEGRKLLWQMDR